MNRTATVDTAAIVNRQVLYWLDGGRFDALSVTSALMRQTKAALTEANISMPDEAREVVFPNGVPVAMLDQEFTDRSRADENGKIFANPINKPTTSTLAGAENAKSNHAEGNLHNTDRQLQQHAEHADVEHGENLID